MILRYSYTMHQAYQTQQQLYVSQGQDIYQRLLPVLAVPPAIICNISHLERYNAKFILMSPRMGARKCFMKSKMHAVPKRKSCHKCRILYLDCLRKNPPESALSQFPVFSLNQKCGEIYYSAVRSPVQLQFHTRQHFNNFYSKSLVVVFWASFHTFHFQFITRWNLDYMVTIHTVQPDDVIGRCLGHQLIVYTPPDWQCIHD